MKKTNEYWAGIYDDSLRRMLARRESEVRLAVSVIRPEDRLPAYGYADYEKLFPLPSHKLSDPEAAKLEVFRMLNTVPQMLRGIRVPREDMADIADWIAPEAAEMAAAAAHGYGVGASISVHIQVFPSGVLSRMAEEEDEDAAARKPLSQEIIQEPEVDDDNGDDEEQVRGSKRRRDDDDDDDDDERVRGSTKRQQRGS